MSSESKPTRSLLEPPHLRALDLVGDRWTLWLLAALEEGHGSRFSDLSGEPGLSRRVLSERLAKLVDAQLVRKEQYQARPARHRYRLTERGVALRRVCVALLHVAGGGILPAPGGRHDSLPQPTPGRAMPEPGAPAAGAGAGAGPLIPVAHGGGDHPTDQLLWGDRDAARRIYEQAIAPLVRYDEQYRTSLVETLEAYLDCDASVGATAARLFAHRHTVRYRLGRVQELTGLDVDSLSDREQLVLGLRALRILRPARG